jgi:hypothetical protein
MAVLSDAERAELSAYFQSIESSKRTVLTGLLAADLKAAVDGIDQWVEDNTTAFNQAIPQPARAALTTQQKAQLLFYVVRRRFEVT